MDLVLGLLKAVLLSDLTPEEKRQRLGSLISLGVVLVKIITIRMPKLKAIDKVSIFLRENNGEIPEVEITLKKYIKFKFDIRFNSMTPTKDTRTEKDVYIKYLQLIWKDEDQAHWKAFLDGMDLGDLNSVYTDDYE